ncbi:MAG TPA: ClpXP protease specificity-enhancing factor SspB [Paracoccus sp. (in: a-proteobacteria)]|uniref:SspB family protein n=1 Tax=uncultured Paracoccus sp. TaxID=189685 RepID=UPI002614E099|nr:ClpXP protease specificity-enhancing factor SspB [uncultured Paracoccus sp.]HMQ41894.1 ClpXP protease specificity-enhancing factor SspB [Paracoccus sp. (in: a-proteobacteria)]HMR37428.1 ClpXP protease specificity-enhancing factor SspB [Paracoccus sp. (in: a-proteobacteria)]
MTGAIDYGGMMHRAMQGLIAEVLTRVAESELPGEHHFFITFDTREDGVEIADWLRERYPAEMTIVIQHWYEDLHVNADGFEITLNFGNSPERLVIPFDALRTFVDPSVEFGLRFETQEGDEDDEDDIPDAEIEDAPTEDPPKGSGEVVSLDKWRK